MVKSGVFDHINFAAEGFLKIGDEAAREERRRSGTSLNQEVEIAVRTGLVAHERTKNLHARHAVVAGDGENSIPFGSLELWQRHSGPMVAPI